MTDTEDTHTCARWLNVMYGQINDIEECIKEHPEITGPGCCGCRDYPPEWE